MKPSRDWIGWVFLAFILIAGFPFFLVAAVLWIVVAVVRVVLRREDERVPGLPVDGEELAGLDLVNWLLIAAAEDENPGPRSHPSQRRGRR